MRRFWLTGTCAALFLTWDKVVGATSNIVDISTKSSNKFDYNSYVSISILIARTALTIGGSRGGREGRTPPPGRPNSFDFMQFSGKFGVFTPPWRVHAPPSGKSWIRHCSQNNKIPIKGPYHFPKFWGKEAKTTTKATKKLCSGLKTTEKNVAENRDSMIDDFAESLTKLC